MAFTALKQRFSNAAPIMRAAAIAVPVAMSMSFSNVANAQDNSGVVQTASVSQGVNTTPVVLASTTKILPDAHRPANVWAAKNPNGVAVSLSLGSDRSIPTETIEKVFASDFKGQGVQQVAFFYEEDTSLPGTGVAFHTDDYVYGPFTLVEARKAVPSTASQMKFNNTVGLDR